MNLLEIGNTIRKLRVTQGLSQSELGRLSGIDRSILSKLEANKLGDIGYNKIERICNALTFELTVKPASPLPTLKDLQGDTHGR